MLTPPKTVRALKARARETAALVLRRAARPGFLPRAQRFGMRTLQTLAARWPAFGDFIEARLSVARQLKRRDERASDTRASAQREQVLQPQAQAQAQPVAAVTLQDLIARLGASATWQARAEAVHALADFDDAQALTAAIGALRDSSVEVAQAAISVLAPRRSALASAALREVLDDPQHFFHPFTRAAALLALADAALPIERARLRAALRDEAAEVSLAAVAALATQREPADTDALRALVDDESGFFATAVREAAVAALGATPSRGA